MAAERFVGGKRAGSWLRGVWRGGRGLAWADDDLRVFFSRREKKNILGNSTFITIAINIQL